MRLVFGCHTVLCIAVFCLTGCDPQAAVEDAVREQVEPEVKPLERVAPFVDYQVATAENPNLVVVENKINASDPISAATQGFFTVSKVYVPVIEQQAQAHRALHGKLPTFEELKVEFDEANQQFKGLKPWQMYAYDAETGRAMILSDPEAEAAAKAD